MVCNECARALIQAHTATRGFTYFAQYLQRKLGIDYVHANELDFKDGKLTGLVKGEIVDGNRKAELLQVVRSLFVTRITACA